MKSEFVTSLQNILEASISGNSDDNEILLKIRLLLNIMDERSTVSSETIHLSKLMDSALPKFLESNLNRINLDSGLPSFDKKYGGLNLGELVILGARPGVGKTQFLLNVALLVSINHPVAFFSCDVSLKVLSKRFISAVSGIPIIKIDRNELSDDDKEKLSNCTEEFGKHQLFINEGNELTIQALRLKCEEAVREHGVKLIILDNLHYLCKAHNRYSRELEINYVCQELRQIAIDLDVCLFASSQLSRSVEYRGGTKVPTLSDLRESGAIEQEADKVLFLYSASYYNINEDEYGHSTENTAELHIAKNSTGKLGMIPLKRDSSFAPYHEFDPLPNDFSFSSNRLSELDDYHF
jgi:replicative DNA helicase